MSNMLTSQMMRATLIHLEKGIAIDHLDLQERQRRRLGRVMTVYGQFVRNPMLNPYELFKDMLRGKVSETNLAREAHRHEQLFNFVLKQMDSSSRKISEFRVRAVGNRLVQMGMDADDGRNIEAGAKILIKVDHLDQPEREQEDISKAMFLPPVIVTSAREIDETKEDLDDEMTRRILSKYGGVEDEKQRLLSERVDDMMAISEARTELDGG